MQKRHTTVAVVDDDPSMLKAAADLLDAQGFSASLFTSAEEFIESGEAEHVDCVLLDIHQQYVTEPKQAKPEKKTVLLDHGRPRPECHGDGWR